MKLNRKVIVAAIISTITIAILLVNLDIITGHSHLEYPHSGLARVFLSIDDLQDAQLIVSFSDEIQSAYIIDIFKDPLSARWGYVNYQQTNASRLGVYLVFTASVERVAIILRPEIEYYLYIEGENLNTTIIAPSNAYIDYINYYSTGNLTIILDECNTDNGSLSLSTYSSKAIDTLKLYVDLPPDFHGWVRLNETGLVTLMDISGWTFDGVDRYTCRSTGESYAMDLRGVNHAYLWLYD